MQMDLVVKFNLHRNNNSIKVMPNMYFSALNAYLVCKYI